MIGAGWGRTGTLSLKAALERVGVGPCHHMFEVFAHPEQMPSWAAAIRGEPWDAEATLTGFRATVDFPSCLAWHDLAEACPDAKVLLSTRSAESWWRSFDATIGPHLRDQPDDPNLPGLRAMFDAILDVALGGRDASLDPERAMAAFEAYNAAVIASLPAERLLCYEVGSGWEPLCEFLDVPVPDEPFPRSNSTEDFLSGHAGEIET